MAVEISTQHIISSTPTVSILSSVIFNTYVYLEFEQKTRPAFILMFADRIPPQTSLGINFLRVLLFFIMLTCYEVSNTYARTIS